MRKEIFKNMQCRSFLNIIFSSAIDKPDLTEVTKPVKYMSNLSMSS